VDQAPGGYVTGIYIGIAGVVALLGLIGSLAWIRVGVRDGLVRRRLTLAIGEKSPAREFRGAAAVFLGLLMILSGSVALIACAAIPILLLRAT
jgi:hypothetical protein